MDYAVGRHEREVALQMAKHGRHIVWQSLASPGLEHVRVRGEGDQIVAQGRTVRVFGGILEDLRWRIECDPAWRTRGIRVFQNQRLHPVLAAECDGMGRWTVQAGGVSGKLSGCIDIDLGVTPFTITLPMRRLGPWTVGEEVRVRVATADPVEGTFRAVRQSYALVSEDDGQRVFVHRNLDTGEEARMSIDEEGYVIDYGGRFRRAWSG